MPESEQRSINDPVALDDLMAEVTSQEQAARKKAIVYTIVPIVIVSVFVGVTWGIVSRLRKTADYLTSEVVNTSQELQVKRQELRVSEDSKAEVVKLLEVTTSALEDININPANAQEKARRALESIPTKGRATVKIIELRDVPPPKSASAPKDSPQSIDNSKVFATSEVDQKAVLLRKPRADYSAEARFARVSGTVRLRVVLAASGQVTGIEVQSSPDPDYGLREKAIEAAKKIEFRPATKDGRKVSTYATLEYNFNFY